MRIIAKIVVTALALWATTFLPGITLGGSSIWVKVGTLLVVAIIFGVINAIIKPVIKTLGCAFYVLTLGLIALVVNALLFLLTGWLAGLLHLPFTVTGFWPALWGAIVVAIVSFILHLIIPDSIDEGAKS
ncbi:phage holin family protein [Fodinicola feengrottensis]|uniref:Phage holin family protein n=1 Tax=Fodinicola feengrottensis TaxID=435914 RepID=A0ABN2IDE7_9ACTN|nr:phage holin family protein [Fodinicola feengrottensis]